jgi:DNA polymerase-3 subunit epsilon
VDVLHGLIGRLGGLGVTSVEELAAYSSRVPERTRRKRHLADGLTNGPGVYLFADGRGRVLYVGTSRDVRSRVRSYFTATEKRTRMSEMIGIAESVTAVECQTVLEAQVRELRLIAEHNPPYNRRSRRPERQPWVKLTAETFPRLSVVRDVGPDGGRDGAAYLGPFASRGEADAAVAALHEAIPLRQCTARLPSRPAPDARACMLAEIGRCGAPCTGAQDRDGYAVVAERARRAIAEDAAEVVSVLSGRMRDCSATGRYEDAARHRDRLLAVLRAAARTQRLRPIAAIAELVAARAEADLWELVLVRHGRLAACATSPRRVDPRPAIEVLRLTGEQVARPLAPRPAGLTAETELILRWLEQPGVRLVDVDGTWCSPTRGAAGDLARLEAAGGRRADTAPADRIGDP